MMSIVLQQRPSFITFTSSDKKFWKKCAPGEVRTLDLQIMRLTLFLLSYWSYLLWRILALNALIFNKSNNGE